MTTEWYRLNDGKVTIRAIGTITLTQLAMLVTAEIGDHLENMLYGPRAEREYTEDDGALVMSPFMEHGFRLLIRETVPGRRSAAMRATAALSTLETEEMALDYVNWNGHQSVQRLVMEHIEVLWGLRERPELMTLNEALWHFGEQNSIIEKREAYRAKQMLLGAEPASHAVH